MKQILAGSAVIVTIIFLLTVAYLRFSSISVDKPEPKQKVSTTQPRVSQMLSGTFKLPADGTIVSDNTKGQKISYKEGQYIRFEQLTTLGKFVCVNRSTPSWETKERSCVSGPTSGNGIVKLMSCSGRDMSIKVTVFNK